MSQQLSVVSNCIDDIITKIGQGYTDIDGAFHPPALVDDQIVLPRERVFEVRDEAHFGERVNFLTPPICGVWYGGIRYTTGDPLLQLSADLSVVIVLMVQGTFPGGAHTQMNRATIILDSVRRVIRKTKSPTGHFWRFTSESAAGMYKNNPVWMQRWVTSVALQNL